MKNMVSVVLNCLLRVMKTPRVWGCDIQVNAVEYHLKKQDVQAAFLKYNSVCGGGPEMALN